MERFFNLVITVDYPSLIADVWDNAGNRYYFFKIRPVFCKYSWTSG